MSSCHHVVKKNVGPSRRLADMIRTTDIVKPYKVQLVHDDDDRLVGINIRAAEGNELDHETVREATRSLLDHLKREQISTHNSRVRSLPAVLAPLKAAYAEGRGKMTPDYLARMAVAYEELAASGASVLVSLAAELDKPVPTIRTHIKRAEEEGYLSATTQGTKEGRKATARAWSQLK